MVDPARRHLQHAGAAISGAEGIRGYRVDRTSTGLPGRKRARQRSRAFRLYAYDAHPALEPGRDARDETAAADGDEDGVEGRRLLLPFQPDGALAGHRRPRIIGMHG